MDGSKEDFNLQLILLTFKQCLNEKEEVLLDPYLEGWRGLVRWVGACSKEGAVQGPYHPSPDFSGHCQPLPGQAVL